MIYGGAKNRFMCLSVPEPIISTMKILIVAVLAVVVLVVILAVFLLPLARDLEDDSDEMRDGLDDVKGSEDE